MTSAEQLAREILREAGFLPEKWRAWLFEELRKDFEAADLEQQRIDELNQRMSLAIQALERVADHLKLRDKKARLALTMREFDAAPERVRKDWTGRRIASAVRGSWQLAKGVAFGEERLPVVPERYWERQKGLARKRREGAFTLGAVAAWLETKPPKKTRGAYDAWAKAQNKKLPEGAQAIPLGKALWSRWRLPLSEIFKAAEEGRIPGEDSEADEDKLDPGEGQAPVGEAGEGAGTTTRQFNFDPAFAGQQLKEVREARGWNRPELAQRTGLDASTIGSIEKAEIRNSSFQTWVKLAEALDLSLDALAAGPLDRAE